MTFIANNPYSYILSKLSDNSSESFSSLLESSRLIRDESIGRTVYLRSLVEVTNRCQKNCHYCGIRCKNQVDRYDLTQNLDLIMECIKKSNNPSVVLQGGEVTEQRFIDSIAILCERIQNHFDANARITLSLGEQKRSVYELWRNAGANRYLLRFETSSKDLFYKIHPNDRNHSFENRFLCIDYLKELDYQVGSGFMVGVPFQNICQLARDILTLIELDVDMVGIGPFIETPNTPMYGVAEIYSTEEKLNLTLKAIALIRKYLPYVNMAATTALEILDPKGKVMALDAGANVVMENYTPKEQKISYSIYHDKQSLDTILKHNSIESENGAYPVTHQLGDSLHYKYRTM